MQEFVAEEVNPVINYFEDNYIGRLRSRGRDNPTFAITSWNVHNRLKDGLPRTNNHIEGWHRKLQASITSSHPNIWKFIDVLKKEQALVDVEINQILGGHKPPKQRKIYSQITERLNNLVEAYENRNILDFLRGIAHNLTV